tara:strand:+ start:348 stop:1226 length:879 start_codon:yes stop_codon:yes gene_type:complete
MKKDQTVILKNRGVISISGDDASNFLQNIITNDIKKITKNNSVFSAILNPQGKYLNEFFIIHFQDGYLLDCSEDITQDIIKNLSKYKLNSKVEINDISKNFVVGIISNEKFEDLQNELNLNHNTILFRDTPIFLDPRSYKLGARILSKLEKLYLTIKKLDLQIIDSSNYYINAFNHGIPEKGLKNLKNQLFGLEANFEEYKAIDFKKGCFVGQENTSRMKLKNKLRRKLFSIKSDEELEIGDDLFFNEIKIGKVLIGSPYAFALIKLYDPDISQFKNNVRLNNSKKVELLNV